MRRAPKAEVPEEDDATFVVQGREDSPHSQTTRILSLGPLLSLLQISCVIFFFLC